MNRTSASTNARYGSTKSGFKGRFTLQAPELLAEAPRFERAVRLGDLPPVSSVVAIGIGCRRKSADRHPVRTLNRAIRLIGHRRILPLPGDPDDRGEGEVIGTRLPLIEPRGSLIEARQLLT
jgi:hypothetical protein